MSLPSPRPIILPASCRPLHPSQGRRLADKLVCPPRVLMLSPVLRTLIPGNWCPGNTSPAGPGQTSVGQWRRWPLGCGSSGPLRQWLQGEPDCPSSCRLGSANELPASLSWFRSRPGDAGLSLPPLHVPGLCTPVCMASRSPEAPSHGSLHGQPLLTLQSQPACHLGEAFPDSLSSRQPSFILCRGSLLISFTAFSRTLFCPYLLCLPLHLPMGGTAGKDNNVRGFVFVGPCQSPQGLEPSRWSTNFYWLNK